MYFVFLLGPAGSGKSTMAHALAEWLSDHGLDAVLMNLDPAVSWLPYNPHVDVRDYITVEEVMRRYNLGPNGALVAAVNLIVNYVESLREEVESMRPNYVLVDTPGQLEVFTFRAAGPFVAQELSRGYKSVTLFLLESSMAIKPSLLAPLLVLSLASSLAIKVPQIITFTKSDLLTKEEFEKLQRWIEDPELMLSDLVKDGALQTYYGDFTHALERALRGAFRDFVVTSAITGQGLDEVYAALQRALSGGEDFYTEEPSSWL